MSPYWAVVVTWFACCFGFGRCALGACFDRDGWKRVGYAAGAVLNALVWYGMDTLWEMLS